MWRRIDEFVAWDDQQKPYLIRGQQRVLQARTRRGTVETLGKVRLETTDGQPVEWIREGVYRLGEIELKINDELDKNK